MTPVRLVLAILAYTIAVIATLLMDRLTGYSAIAADGPFVLRLMISAYTLTFIGTMAAFVIRAARQDKTLS